MPTYHVQCADRDTGEDYIARIPAADPPTAQKIALAKGHLVSAVIGEDAGPVPPPPPATATSDPAMLAELRAMRQDTHRMERRTTPFSIVRVILLLIIIPIMLLLLVWAFQGAASGFR